MVTVPVYIAHEIVSIGSVLNSSLEVNITVMVSLVFAYPEFVVLFELNVVVPVNVGDVLSILNVVAKLLAAKS